MRFVWTFFSILAAAALAALPVAGQPAPKTTITSLNPGSAILGSAGFTMTINGANILDCPTAPCLTVNWSPPTGSPTTIRPSSVGPNGNFVTAAIPASLLTTPGNASVSVTGQFGLSNSLTFTVNYPTPSISILSPNGGVVGGSAFTLTVTGSGFVNGSAVEVNGSSVATTFVTGQTLTAAVPASFLAAAGNLAITVVQPNGLSSAVADFPVTYPTPAIASLNPAQVAASTTPVAISINGTGFFAASTVQINGAATSSTLVTPQQLTATVPASALAAPGQVNVTVTNPGPLGSNTVILVVVAPAITSLSPPSAIAGSAAFTLTVNGANFISGSMITWNGTAITTFFNSPTQLTASVSANLIGLSGTAAVRVQNTPQAISGPSTFTITAKPLTLTNLTPSSATAGSATLTLTVTGTGFVSGSVVDWNGFPLGTTFDSGTQLAAAVPASLLAQSGNATVEVTNPDGSQSNTATFTINPAPLTITSINPASATAGAAAFTLAVTGTGFLNGAVVYWNSTALATTFGTATQLTAAVPANLLAQAGTATIQVVNPNETQSNTATFTINAAPPPTIISINPASATAGSAALTLTVTGTGFLSGAVVNWNSTALATTFGSATQLTAAVPASLLAQAGTATIQVVNPNKAQSNTVGFTISSAPPPTITSINPASATAGSAALTLTVTGTGFLSGAVVNWNSTALATTFGGATQLTAAVPASLLTQAGTATIQVVNPNNTQSNTVGFTISSAPPPIITTLSPASTGAGGSTFTLTVNGIGFVSGSAVNWNGSALATAFVNGGQLTAPVDASLIASPGSAAVTVVNPNGAASGAATFTITVPAPPTVTFSGPSTTGPMQQPSITFAIGAPYALAIQGQVVLTFTPDAVNPADDPAIQFAAGGRTLTFTIPANSAQVPAILIQTGTVSGTIRAHMTLTGGGASIPVSDVVIQISRAAPVIRSVAATRGSGSLQLSIVGYSTPREVTQATFHFNPVGSAAQIPDVTVSVGSLFSPWFQGSASTQYGSQFTYTQSFTIQGDSTQIGTIVVTLTSSAGNSQPVTSN